jgi:hypothetical protein
VCLDSHNFEFSLGTMMFSRLRARFMRDSRLRHIKMLAMVLGFYASLERATSCIIFASVYYIVTYSFRGAARRELFLVSSRHSMRVCSFRLPYFQDLATSHDGDQTRVRLRIYEVK